MAHEPRLGYQRRDEKVEGEGSRCQQKSLTTIAVEEEATGNNWPTPCNRDYKGESGKGRQERKGYPADTLPNAVVQFGPHDPANPNTIGNSPDLWGTPTVRNPDRKESTMAKCQKFRESKGKKTVPKYLQEQVKDAKPKTGGILSPNWVEQLMGLPVGWTQVGTASTASAHSGTDASPPPLPSPSEPSTTN